MADKTDAQIVTALRDAIYALSVTNIQSYTLDDTQVTKNDLPRLRESLDYFERRSAKSNRPRLSYGNLSMS